MISFVRNLDFVNLMAYDLHGSWEQDLGHHASLFPGPGDDTNDKKLTVVGVAHIHEYRYSCMFQIV